MRLRQPKKAATKNETRSRSRRRQANAHSFVSPSPPLSTQPLEALEQVPRARVYKRAIIISVLSTLLFSWWFLPRTGVAPKDPFPLWSKRMATISESLLGPNGLLKILDDECGGGILSLLLPANLSALVKPVAQWAATNEGDDGNDAASPGKIWRAKGARVKHPVVMIPGIISSGLELWEGEPCAAHYFRQRPWGTLTMLRMMLLDKECWLRHVRIQANGLDPSGIRLRAARGIEAADWLMPGYWVWARVVENLAELGYDHENLLMGAYDWRLDIEQLELRDRYFTRLQSEIELMVRLRRDRLADQEDGWEDGKAVILCHSLGAQVWFYFMQWITRKSPNWVDDHIHSYVSIGGPMLGVAKTLSAVISGESRDTAQMGMLESFLLERFLSKRERISIFRSWTGGMGILPLGGRAIWPHPLVTMSDCPEEGQCLSPSLGLKQAYYADDYLELLKKLMPKEIIARIERIYKREAAKDAADLKAKSQDSGYWLNPLAAPLPHAPKMRIYCLYGVGRPTEVGYVYRMATTEEMGIESTAALDESLIASMDQQSLIIPLHLDTDMNDPDRHLLRGVYHDWQGDATVGLLSNGFMCTRGWRHSRLLNPSRSPTINREYQDDPSASGLTDVRGGPKSGDHVDILGNLEFLEDIMAIASGHDFGLEDRFYTDIRERSEWVELNILDPRP